MVKRTTRSGRKEDHHGRKEEVHDRKGQEARASQRTRAQARRRYGPQGRLAHLLSPWWARERRWLREQITQLEGVGFRVRYAIERGDLLRLEITGGNGSLYLATFQHNFQPGDTIVVARYATANTYSTGIRLLAAIQQLAEGRGLPVLGPGRPRIILPNRWTSAKPTGGGALRLGRAAIGGAYAALGLDGTPEHAELTAAAGRLAAAFPAIAPGIWAAASVSRAFTLDAEAIVAAAEQTLAAHRGDSSPDTVRALLRESIGAVHSPSHGWEFVRRDEAGRAVVFQVTYLPADPVTRWAPYFHALANNRVAVVGCGAVGWSVAHLLVRSGVGSLALFDPDMVSTFNLVRLGAFIGDAGRYKVEALADQLRAAAPGVEVTATPLHLGRGIGAKGLLEARPDLILDLTADIFSTDEVNLAALARPCPAIFAWLSNGVQAARLIRVRPYESACYECVRSAEPAPLDAIGPIAPGATWVGATFDVEVFAGAVARMAARTLRGEPVGRGNPDHVVLRFGSVAPTERALTIERRANCFRCGR